MRRIALAAKKQPSKLLFEKLDRARQGGLGNVAALACPGEIQLLGYREEITNLMHFHDDLTRNVGGGPFAGRLELGWRSLRVA